MNRNVNNKNNSLKPKVIVGQLNVNRCDYICREVLVFITGPYHVCGGDLSGFN